MLRMLGVVLLVAATYAATANAHGGGPAESMPGTNYTDMPDFSPRPFVSPWIRHKQLRSRAHQHPVRGD